MSAPSPSFLGLLRRLLWGALALLAVGFVAAALTRRLNFDEALALRAGWLLVEGIPASPPFTMPSTWLLGLLGSVVPDPGAVLLAARIAVVATVGPLLGWSLAACGRPATVALAALLTLSQATFVVHALEFRYDWALLVGWLIAYRLIRRGREGDFLWLGVVAAWLAAHHLKGLYFAGCLILLALLAALSDRDRARRRVARLAAGALGALALWVAVSALLGFGGELGRVYSTFFELAAGTADRVAPWTALAGTLRRDAVWWIGAALAVAASCRGLAVAPRPLPRHDLWTLAFALLPLGFVFLHPHAWAYMLVLPAPFLALLMAERLAEVAPRPAPAVVAAATLLVLALQWAVTRATPWQVYFDSLAAPRGRQVATLRLLRERAKPADRIFDPSGLAYFVAPCVDEWYLDTLFRDLALRGRWMADLHRLDLATCPWMLNTYRLRMLPDKLEARLAGAYTLIDGAGGLALHVDDPRLIHGQPWPGLAYRELRSFW